MRTLRRPSCRTSNHGSQVSCHSETHQIHELPGVSRKICPPSATPAPSPISFPSHFKAGASYKAVHKSSGIPKSPLAPPRQPLPRRRTVHLHKGEEELLQSSSSIQTFYKINLTYSLPKTIQLPLKSDVACASHTPHLLPTPQAIGKASILLWNKWLTPQ